MAEKIIVPDDLSGIAQDVKENTASISTNTANITANAEAITTLQTAMQGGVDMDKVYPVGSIYMSVNSIDPGTLFGGTWERLKDCFLLAAGDTYTAGATGGEAEHTLTEAEIPKHRHNIRAEWSDRQTTDVLAVGTTPITSITSETGGLFNLNNNHVTGYIGSGTAHNNMPPYLAVYAWKRTA